MAANPERNSAQPTTLPVEFAIEVRDITPIFSQMATSYADERAFPISTNWSEIYDFRYDVYKSIEIAAHLTYRPEKLPGRPTYKNYYFIEGRLPYYGERHLKEIQEGLDSLGVHMDLVKMAHFRADEKALLLEGAHLLSISMKRPYLSWGAEEGNFTECIDLARYEYDEKKGYFIQKPMPLKDLQSFRDNFKIFTDVLGKLVKVRYGLAKKSLPEANLVLTPKSEEIEKVRSGRRIPCEYCGSLYSITTNPTCPHCGGTFR